MKAAAAGVVLLAAIASPAAALPDLPEGKWWKRPRIAAAVGLTAEQAREIEGIFSRSRSKLIDLKADLEKRQGDLEDALSESADRKEVAGRVEAVEDARAELQKARILMLLDMKEVLKPEQWDRLVRMQQDFRRQRLERMDRFRDSPRRPPGDRPPRDRPRR